MPSCAQAKNGRVSGVRGDGRWARGEKGVISLEVRTAAGWRGLKQRLKKEWGGDLGWN